MTRGRTSLKCRQPIGRVVAALIVLTMPWTDVVLAQRVSHGSGGVVVSESPEATRVGIDVLRGGGNAVDAAIAVAMMLAVTFPEAGNLGGGGFMLVRESAHEPVWCLDFRETAPSGMYPEFYEERARDGDAKAATMGPLSAAIPGTPRGLYEAWQRGGSVPWPALVRPARESAESGIVVDVNLHEQLLSRRKDLVRYPSTVAVFFPHDRCPEVGDTLRFPDLANTLRLLEAGGGDAFYTGAFARAIVAGVRTAGGTWELHDLGAYAPVFREPMSVEIPDRGLTIVSAPPPSSGGFVFSEILLLLAQQSVPASLDPAHVPDLVTALGVVFRDRNAVLADPLAMTTSVDSLLGAKRLAELWKQGPHPERGGQENDGTPRESYDTTHLVVMDAMGGVVSLTTTINGIFGSKFIAPGTGVLLNNEMDDFDTRPGKANMYGLVGRGPNDVRAGMRMLSSMSPTFVMKGDEVILALGARGGPRILTSVFQVILARFEQELDLAFAVSRPRLHYQSMPDTVLYQAGLSPLVLDRLDRRGYATKMVEQVGKVLAAERTGPDSFTGVVDPRSCGVAQTVVERNR